MATRPLLPTSVIGSYSFPRWLDHVRDQGSKGVLTAAQVQEAHDNAVKSVIKDQELAGVDIITDGEMQRVDFNLGFYDYLEGIKPLPPTRQWGPPAHDQRCRYLCVEPVQAPRGLGLVAGDNITAYYAFENGVSGIGEFYFRPKLDSRAYGVDLNLAVGKNARVFGFLARSDSPGAAGS